ncbi:hypothetical protein ACOZ4N_04800 [Halorientalis pallida]|uniref:hypothetical protein n=1 Tax=Halorientalis pallida TaxID=2479928 RepID=UPI003C6FDCDE
MSGEVPSNGRMTRRRALQTVGAGGALALAGCIHDDPPCRDRHVDLSTGTTNFVPDAFGVTDTDWRVVSSPDNTTGQAISVQPVSQWVTLTSANWIDPYGTGGWPTTVDPVGDYVYEIDFSVPDTWEEGQCQLRIHNWSVDDQATLELDGPSGTTQLDQGAGHQTLKGPVFQPVTAGQYTLRARVRNNLTVSGLLVDADLFCDCDAPVDDGECDLSIRKEHSGESVTYGDTTEFQITVCNDGDGRCEDTVTVEDDLPGGTTYTGVSGSGWTATESGGVVTAEHQNANGLAPGACLPTLTIEVDVGSQGEVGDVLANCATVLQGDADATYKEDCIKVPVGEPDGKCDLAIEKTHAGGTVAPGDTTEFQITVCNEGDRLCRGLVTVVDDLPNGVSYVGATGSGWSVSESGGVVTAEHLNTSGLAPGDCLPTITIEVEVGSQDEVGDAIRNCAHLKYGDADTTNDRDCVQVPVDPNGGNGECDLSITKRHDGEPVAAGDTTEFQIVVCNDGEGTCVDPVRVVDDLPNGVSYVGASGTGWSFTENGGLIECEHPNTGGLAPGDCLPTITIEVEVGSMDETGDVIRNCAHLEGENVDPDLDQSCVSVPVTSMEEGCDGLEVEKTTASQFTYGDQNNYEIQVCNTADTQCNSSVTVTDDIPDGMTFVAASGSGWSASVNNGVVTATHANTGGLAPGDCLPLLTLTVDVVPASAFPGGSDEVRNCARLAVDGAVVHSDCVTHVITNQ